jgi:hypothetical protein
MLDVDVREDLNTSLAGALRSALRSVDVARTLARIEYTIKTRVARGEFLPGSSPGAESYSTEPFARPAGGLPQKVHDAAEKEGSGVASYFTKDEDLWMTFEGGYKQLREMKGLQTARVDLMDTGQMLAGMRAQAAREPGGDLQMEVGYIEGLSPAEAIQLANYHDRLGAGKSQVVRKFIGLTDTEAETILDDLEDEIEEGLND